MKRPYQISGMVLLLLSLFVIRESTGLRFYAALGPGPGFFPLWIGIIVGVMAVVTLYQATFYEPHRLPDGFMPSKQGYLRIGAILLALAATVVLLIPLGFRLTMLAFLTLLLSALGRQNLLVTALVALAGSFGLYHVFAVWLAVPLPIGSLGV